jgi:signal transduction histidine kinase
MRAVLCVQNGNLSGRTFPVEEKATVGKDPLCDIHLPDPSLGDRHFTLQRGREGYFLLDEGSEQGTFVDGRKVDESPLLDHSTIFAGDLVLSLSIQDDKDAEPVQEESLENEVRRIYESSVISLVNGAAVSGNRGATATPLEAIYRIGRLLSADEDLGVIFQKTIAVVGEVLEAQRCFLLLYQAGPGTWKQGAGWSLSGDWPSSEGLPGTVLSEVLRSGMSTLIHDARTDERFSGEGGIRSALSVPLLARRRSLGVLWADRTRSSRPFTEDHLKLLAAIGRQAGGGIERRMLERELRQYSETLETRVANRTRELARTLQSLARGQSQLVHSERLAAVGLLVQGVAHNMGTPLAVIKGTAQVLQVRHGEITEMKRILDMTDRLEAIVETLLRKGRRESEPDAVDVDLGELCRDTLAFFEGDMFFKHEVRAEVRTGPDVPRVRVVYSDVSQALQNLVGNAIDALRDVRAPRELTLTASREGTDILVSVTDTGPGVAAEILPRLFSPFATTKGGGDKPRGTGLGLYTARRLMEPYEGEVELRAQEGHTTFLLRLPDRWAVEGDGHA